MLRHVRTTTGAAIIAIAALMLCAAPPAAGTDPVSYLTILEKIGEHKFTKIEAGDAAAAKSCFASKGAVIAYNGERYCRSTRISGDAVPPAQTPRPSVSDPSARRR